MATQSRGPSVPKQKKSSVGNVANASRLERDPLASAAHDTPLAAPSEASPRNATNTPASMISLRAPIRPRAFELLATQPTTLAGLSQAVRDAVVVIAVADEQGNEHIVSRFGDSTWNMAPEVETKNRSRSELIVSWPDDVSEALVNDAKAALYCAFRRGRHNGRPWSASLVARVGQCVAIFLRHIASMGLRNFSDVRAVYLSDLISDLRRRLHSDTVRKRLEIIDLVWAFPNEVFYPLLEHPWGGRYLSDACQGLNEEFGPSGRTGKTPVIPRSVQRMLFGYCEARLDEADELFNVRDTGGMTASSYHMTAIRDAVVYLMQITSGMRNSETMGITTGCWRTEVRNGISFHWVRTREIKTSKGEVDFLVPPEALRALQILQRYAAPLQARLADEARWLDDLLRRRSAADGILTNGMTVPEAVQRLNHVREIAIHQFLSIGKRRSDHLGTGSRVEVLNIAGCNAQLKKLARAAETNWDLANHQCRRTFAYNVANSRLGRMGLVFLKWQLKHASLSWSQLYASNPYQDHALYLEFEGEMIEARVELLEGWLQSDVPLSGGAGRKLVQTRATAARDLEHLLRHTAESVELRSTGHAWCLSGTRACHGQGLYDPAMCGGCSQAVIDRDQASTWQMIHLDNLRLAAIADCGPAVTQKANRAIERSAQVLQDLGEALPTKRQIEAYASRHEAPGEEKLHA